MIRVLIADRSGIIRSEITPDIEAVSWVLNGIGSARFSLASSDPGAIEENLRPGNRVLIQFANGLPSWGGVIDLPRQWRDGRITVNAYTIEHLWQYRICDRATTFNAAPVGSIFVRVLREMEAEWPEGIEIGRVWYGGAPHYPRYHYRSLRQIMDSIRRMERCDIVCQPLLAGGRITFLANLTERWGADRTGGYALIEGANVSELTYEEQGPLINDIVVAGAGTTWTSERLVVRGIADDSVQRYGRRSRLEIRADVTMVGTLEMHARLWLTRAQPLRRFGLTVVNAPPAAFADYDIGDILPLQCHSVGWGYNGRVRVIGRGFQPSDGCCTLAVDHWIDDPSLFIREEEGEGDA